MGPGQRATVPIFINHFPKPQSIELAEFEFPPIPVHIMGLPDLWWHIGHQLSDERVCCECGVIDGDDVG